MARIRRAMLRRAPGATKAGRGLWLDPSMAYHRRPSKAAPCQAAALVGDDLILRTMILYDFIGNSIQTLLLASGREELSACSIVALIRRVRGNFALA
jgi:hypothetical protein